MMAETDNTPVAPPPYAADRQAAQAAQYADIRHRFAYHAPDAAKVQRHQTIRQAIETSALDVVEFTRPSREQSLALTHLEEAMFWANAAIARETT
jgi:hypothetical protein